MTVPSVILRNGARMPMLGLGTFRATDSAELENALEAAFDSGYRHFDTAYLYQNETLIGEVFQKWFKEGKAKREDLFITTKLPVAGIHPDRVEKFLNQSLKNLQVEYVDLYLIHFPVCAMAPSDHSIETNDLSTWIFEPEPTGTDHVAVWKKLEEQVTVGKAKAIGVSNFTVRQLNNVLNNARIKPASLQMEFNIYFQQNELLDICNEHGITVVAHSPLGKGSTNASTGQVLIDREVLKLSKRYSKTPAQILLRFLLQRNIAVIPKSVNPSRIKENIEVFDFRLNEMDMNALKKLHKGEAGRVCDFLAGGSLYKSPEWPVPKQE